MRTLLLSIGILSLVPIAALLMQFFYVYSGGNKIRLFFRRIRFGIKSYDWEPSANAKIFFLFPSIKDLGKEYSIKELHWLWWVWVIDKTKKKDLYEQILDDTETREIAEEDPRAVRRRMGGPLSMDGVVGTWDPGFDPSTRSVRHRRNFSSFFEGRAGFAVYASEMMIGWAEQPDVSFELRREMLDVTTSAIEREFIPGRPETLIRANNFHLLVEPSFMDGLEMIAMILMPDDRSYRAVVHLSMIESGIGGTVAQSIRQQLVDIYFRGSGAMERLS